MRHRARILFLLAALATSATLVAQGVPTASPKTDPRDPAGTATISGDVLADETGQPIAGVRVTRWLSGGANPQHEVITDDRGRFVFHDVGAGTYQVVAEFPGRGLVHPGDRRSGANGRLTTVGDGQQLGGLTMRMFPNTANVVSGTIVDDAGEPAVGVMVYALPRAMGASSDHPLFNFPSSTTTDDRGQYALRLADGDYLVVVPVATTITVPASLTGRLSTVPSTANIGVVSVVVPPRAALVRGDLRVFVGDPARAALMPRLLLSGPSMAYAVSAQGGASPDAGTLLSLRDRTNRPGIDFALKLQPASQVTGRVTGPDGPVARVGVRLLMSLSTRILGGGDGFFDVARALTDDAGRFTLTGVPPGQYTVHVFEPPKAAEAPAANVAIESSGQSLAMSESADMRPALASPGPTLFADLPIGIGQTDVTGIEVNVRRGAMISGHVVFDSVKPPPVGPALARIAIVLRPLESSPVPVPSGHPDASGAFMSGEYPPGRYQLTGPPLPWLIKSATYHGRDVLWDPIELGPEGLEDVVVTLTDKFATLSGVVQNDRSQPNQDATVLVFPTRFTAPAGAQYLKEARVSPDGRYSATSLVAGDYFVVAIDDKVAGGWRDASSLPRLAQIAARVTVQENERRSLDLKTAALR